MSDFNGNRGGYNGPRKEVARYGLNDFSNTITGKTMVGGAARLPTMQFAANKSGIRITVNTFVGEGDEGKIMAVLNMEQTGMFLNMMQHLAKGGDHNELPVLVIANEVRDKSGAWQARHRMNIEAKRNGEGVIALVFSGWRQGGPHVPIELLPSALTRLSRGDGSPIPPADQSRITCQAWANILTQLLPLTYVDQYPKTTPAPSNGNGGGNGGGGFSGGNNGGGYQKGGYQKSGGGYQNRGNGGGGQSNGGYSGGGGFSGGGQSSGGSTDFGSSDGGNSGYDNDLPM